MVLSPFQSKNRKFCCISVLLSFHSTSVIHVTFHVCVCRKLTQPYSSCQISAKHQHDDALITPSPFPNCSQARDSPAVPHQGQGHPRPDPPLQTCMWLCGLSWMPVTRSAWPHRSRRVSSVFTLSTFTKSPEAHSRYLQGETPLPRPERPGRPAAAAGRGDTGGQSPAGSSGAPPSAAAPTPVPLAWSRRRTRPWRRAGRCPRTAPRGARPAPPSCPAAARVPPRPALIGPAAASRCGRAARAPPHGDTAAAQEGSGPKASSSIAQSGALAPRPDPPWAPPGAATSPGSSL